MSDDNKSSLGQLAILRLLQQNANKPGLAPEGTIQRIAEEYAKSRGIKLDTPDLDVKVKPSVSAKIAEAYANMHHAPNDPKVKRAYDALIKETEDQFEKIQKSGLKISKIEPGMENPYKNSSALIDDIKTKKHMWYFPTEQGYGTGAIDAVNDHPLLKPSKVIGPDGKPMPANDLFRVVHDYFGHGKDGNKFGATGEERAYLEHKKMYSPEAQKALASETRGQNSWVNYGPHGEANRANPANTIYAEQKAGLLPDWAAKHVDEIDSPIKYNMKKGAKMAGKAALPLAVISAPLLADTLDQGLAELIVPGGADNVGESAEEERLMLAEDKARKAYEKSPAHENHQKNQSLRMNVLRSLAEK